MARSIAFRLYVAWDGTNFTQETSRLISATGENRLTPPDQAGTSSKGIVDKCSLELDNHDGRYSALNSAGALYANLQNGGAYHAPMYLEVSINGGTNYYRVFTGVVKIPQETTVTSRETGMVRIECRSVDELLLARRTSTTISNMQARTGYMDGQHVAAWLDDNSIAGYTCDAGVFNVQYAWLDDESILDEIWNMASACGGRFYADPDGQLRYEDITHWLKSPHTTSQETLSRDDYAGLAVNYADSDLYNVVTVETSPRFIDAPDKLWTPDEVVSVAPSSTKKITARLRSAAYSIDAPDFKAATGGGWDITSDVTVSPTLYVQRVELSITNANTTQTAYVSPFQLTGRALNGGPTQEESRNSADNGSNSAWWTAVRGTRTKAIRGNAYIQTRAMAGSLALFLLNRCEYPRLTYKLQGCPGKPTRRCGDRVTIDDSEMMSATRDVFVTAISWRLNNSGFQQDLEAVDCLQLFPLTSYAIVGTNKVGSAGNSLALPIFY